MREKRFPDALVLIFAMIVIAQLATYVLPAGKFTRQEIDGRERVVPGTYERVEADKLSPLACLAAIPQGLEAGGDVIFFVFIVGGVIGVVRATGAIDALIGAAIKNLGHRPIWLVAGMVALFACGSATIGMAEEYMPFIPILVTMCIAMKMDAVVAMGIVYVGAGIGYGSALMNPFTVFIAQDIADLPAGSGWPMRLILLLVCLAVGIHHLMRYARRIGESPESSLVADVEYGEGFDMPSDSQLTSSRIVILSIFVLGIAIFVVGASLKEWYFTELSTIFLLIAIISATIARLHPNLAASKFCKGASEMTTTALLIGFARAIQVVLEEGQVIDTVINSIAQPLQQTGPFITSTGMLIVQSVCNFFIPSGSGQAYVTMPIMAPLADLTSVSRQTAVLAYQLGDGFTNMIVPTNALLMGMLALGKIPFQRWLRFVLPLLLKLYLVAIVALWVAVAIRY